MKLLFLGNSNDAGQWFEGGKKRHEILAEQLEVEFGEPVEVIVKSLWPTAKLPSLVAGWVEQSEPDVIYIASSAYWFLYRSVPLRAQRLLGKVGPAAGTAGFKVASSKRWSHNVVFRTARRGLQATVGGDPNFTPEEVAERMCEIIRIAVRREGAAVYVKGPQNKTKYSTTPLGLARDEKKRLKVHNAMKTLCAQLHVPYEGTDAPVFDQAVYRSGKVGDGLHSNASRHAYDADWLFGVLRQTLIDAGHEPVVRPPSKVASE